MSNTPTVVPQSWETFRASGLLWWINGLLHMFGWAIVMDVNEDQTIESCYPARVRFRGFNEASNDAGYIKVTDYLKAHIDELVAEAHES